MIENEMAADCYCNRLRSASRAITRVYDGALKPLDVKVSQLSVLTAVKMGQGGLTIVDIAERLAMDRSTLSRNFEPLERRGLVVLGPEERHRARKVVLTEAGAALLEAAYPLWKQAQQTVAGAVGDMKGTTDRLVPLIEKFGN
ncbi:MAG: MarR family winged helix-turn-helix transcriptional regulator [Rhodospirillales bacterium]